MNKEMARSKLREAGQSFTKSQLVMAAARVSSATPAAVRTTAADVPAARAAVVSAASATTITARR